MIEQPFVLEWISIFKSNPWFHPSIFFSPLSATNSKFSFISIDMVMMCLPPTETLAKTVMVHLQWRQEDSKFKVMLATSELSLVWQTRDFIKREKCCWPSKNSKSTKHHTGSKRPMYFPSLSGLFLSYFTFSLKILLFSNHLIFSMTVYTIFFLS